MLCFDGKPVFNLRFQAPPAVVIEELDEVDEGAVDDDAVDEVMDE